MQNQPPRRRSSTSSHRVSRWGVGIALLLATLGGGAVFADWWTCLPETASATYVGRQSCIQCHQQQGEQWQGSHHDLAMDRASAETVLGDFEDAQLEHDGIVSRMFRKGEGFFVNTEGPDGKMADFEVKYVFGVEPLQQYMVEFDRLPDMPADEIARLQVLRISWDTERKEWFYLRPPDVDEKLSPDDDLHWTGIAQRWNNMCADCHSTNLKKNFDVASATYHTTFSEMDVSCEACHGPGSLHVELANSNSLFWDRKQGYALAKLKDADPKVEIHACAPCHSRRRIVHPDFRPGENYYDYYANELLQEHTYHSDGQILDEVYVFGSYIQSKMFHKSIRCSDCHDPHTARLKHSGNQVCTSCHQHSAGKYDSPAHHRHTPGTPGAQCVSCHMPSTTYMAVDPRRDHSLRVPRPDLSVDIGTPNSCTACHLERAPLSPERRANLAEYSDWVAAARVGDEEVREALATVDKWATDACLEWYGPPKETAAHFARALNQAHTGDPAAEATLLEVARNRQYTGVVRATSLQELARFGSERIGRQAAKLLGDADPQVRTAALGLTSFLPNDELMQKATPLLKDPVRSVRTEAGRVLARVPAAQFGRAEREDLRAALDEFERGMLMSNDRATAHLTLGVLYESQGEIQKARRAYRLAIKVEPGSTGPRTNLAALYDQLGQQLEREIGQRAAVDREGATQLAEQLLEYREQAQELRREELALLARDAKLAPENAAVQYRYGLSLYLHNRYDDAETALVRAVELEPNTSDFALAVALLYQKLGRFKEAIVFCERTVALQPQNQSYQNLLAELRQAAQSAAP